MDFHSTEGLYEGPLVKKVLRPFRVQLAPHTNGTPKDFKLVRYACDLRVWDRWRIPCAPQGREKMMR